jgi:mRNA interferase RelE/StbE
VPYRVELIAEAVEDLQRVARTGRITDFLTKLVRIEEHGPAAGLPLGSRQGKSLTGWRKIVVGDRDWRIVYRVDEAAGKATVLVIGDRADADCYAQALSRLAGREDQADALSLSQTMLLLLARKGGRGR